MLNPGQSRKLHSYHNNMLDTRYIDPNILRIGSDWVPYDKRAKSHEEIKQFKEELESWAPGIENSEGKLLLVM